MSFHQPNRAPEGCREPLCGYLEQRSVAGEHHDRCLHSIPMQPGCGWHRTPEQVAAISAQETDAVIGAKRQGRRG